MADGLVEEGVATGVVAVGGGVDGGVGGGGDRG